VLYGTLCATRRLTEISPASPATELFRQLMLASPYHQITSSNSVRGVLLWLITCFTVFYVLNGLATRPLAVEVESFRHEGMSDEQVLSMALQKANAIQANRWWINDREAYLVFDTTRDYNISKATYQAFDLELEQDAEEKPIAIIGQKIATMRTH